MIKALERPSSWVGKIAVLGVALLGSQLHEGGALKEAFADGGAALVIGTVVGLMMVGIVVARLLGRNVGLIHSDRGALVALLVMIAVKIAIARTLLPL